MTDLENLLLEAAGRMTAAKRNCHSVSSFRRKSGGAHSDDGNDSGDEDSDDNHDYMSKRPASQVPLKKRYEATEGEHYQGSDGEDNFRAEDTDNSDVGSDLYKYEDDKKRLAEMIELEREMILSDKAIKKDEKTLKEKLKLKLDDVKSKQSRKKKLPLTSALGARSSSRTADRTAAMDSALN